MRVALCASGYLRNFEHTFPMNRKAWAGASYDLFLHLWDAYGFEASDQVPGEALAEVDTPAVSRVLGAPEGGLVVPTVLRIEPTAAVSVNVPGAWGPAEKQVFAQFHKTMACDRLRQRREARGGFAYDLVVHTRPDVVFSKVPWEECARRLPEGTIGLFRDIALVGRPATMARLTAASEFLPKYLESGAAVDSAALWRQHAATMRFAVVELPFTASVVGRRTFFDVGANNGSWGIKVAKAEPSSRVYAFEPTPELIATIKKRAAGLPNYHLIEKAVSSSPGTAEFHISAGGDWGCSSLLEFKPEDDIRKQWPGRLDIGHTHTIQVECITMKDFVDTEKISAVHYFHCDVQGMDLEVLKSFGDRIGAVRAGVIEAATSLKGAIYANQTATVEVCREWLTAQGFEIQRIQSNDVQNNEVNIYFHRVR